MSILAAIFAALKGAYGAQVLVIIAGIPALLVQGILTITGDQQTIFLKALGQLIADIKAGKDWQTAFTDMLNTFYSSELTEGDHLALGFLEYVAQAIGAL